jgi:hypothetical protein
MQLRVARLCHDCEELHAEQQCPLCASETFTFITRWVPVPERRGRPRPTSSEEAEVVRQLLEAPAATSTRMHWLKGAAVGVTTLGVIGWLSRRSVSPKAEREAQRTDTVAD